jgi:hypothetical protein
MGKRSLDFSVARANELANEIICQIKEGDSVGEIGSALATVVVWFMAGAPDDEHDKIWKMWKAMAEGMMAAGVRMESLH